MNRTWLIAVGVTERPQACDATLLAATIAGATGAGLLLVTVQRPRPAAAVRGVGSGRQEAQARLQDLGGFMAPRARTVVETDVSVSRGLSRVVSREHSQLLVLGSRRKAAEGQVRIGRHTRHLLAEKRCAVAVAPRGLGARGRLQLAAIGVGYDGSPEADEALSWAAALARAAGARLRVRAVVDDRLPSSGTPRVGGSELQEVWDTVIAPDAQSLRERAEHSAAATGIEAAVEAAPGSPPEDLIALSREVDLLAIGSHHWGSSARMRRSTGEELMNQACCSVMAVPAPRSATGHRAGPGEGEAAGQPDAT